MKKILFLVQLPPPVHGVSAVNNLIYNSLILNKNFETAYIDISPSNELDEIGKLQACKLFKTFFIFINTLVSFVKFKPNLVYMTLSPYGLAFYKDGILAIALKILGASLVFHMHGKGIKQIVEKSKFKKYIYKFVFKNVDVIHLSERLFTDIESVRDLSNKIFALPNGVKPVEHFSHFRDKKIVFIYLSNLVRLKGADILVHAISLIPEKYHNLFCVKIIGKSSSQDYIDELIETIKSNNIKNVEICGPKYDKDKEIALTSSDVFVLPTKNDCFPLSILEAMSAGLAVISTNQGAIPDMVESGITGEIIDNCSPEEIASAMLKFINNPDYLRNCGLEAKKKYELMYKNNRFEQDMTLVLESIGINY